VTLEGIRIALSALRENKLRTFLTLLGNIVGTMAVIAVVSLIDGIDMYAREEIAAEGSNVVTLNQFDFFELLTDFDAFLKAIKRNPKIVTDDLEFLEDRLPSATAQDASVGTRAAVRAGSRAVLGAQVQGRTDGFTRIENIRIDNGRPLSPLEIRRSKPVAVVGSEIAESLWPGQDPLGRTRKISGRHFRVIGVSAPRTAQLGNNRNRFVIVPITTYGKTFGDDESVSLKFRAGHPGSVGRLQDEIRHAMRRRHRLRPTETDDFALTTSLPRPDRPRLHLARRRRRRSDERDARRCHREDTGDRDPEGARSDTLQHPAPVPRRVGHPLRHRRDHRCRPRVRHCRGHLRFHTRPERGPALGDHGGPVGDPGDRDSVRNVSGEPGGTARSGGGASP